MTPPRIVVTGSVAYDYLMTFPGKFLDVVVPDRMHRLSVSFLVDSMRRVRGGVAPNIAYGLALFGLKPVIMATAGVDALDYARWLAEEGVDTSELHISDDLFTASFFVSTDEVQNQIATFYTGAMARAVDLSFRALRARDRVARGDRAERSRGDDQVRGGVPDARASRSSTTRASRSRGSQRRRDPRRARRRGDPDRERVRVRRHREEDGAFRGRGPRRASPSSS